MMDARVYRQVEWTKAWILTIAFGIARYFSLSEIPRRFHWLFLIVAGIFIYSRFVKAGLFSLLDLVGWLSIPLINRRSAPAKPRIIRIPADPSETPRATKIGLVLAGGGGKGAYQI